MTRLPPGVTPKDPKAVERQQKYRKRREGLVANLAAGYRYILHEAKTITEARDVARTQLATVPIPRTTTGPRTRVIAAEALARKDTK